jgi:hypothetical protein
MIEIIIHQIFWGLVSFGVFFYCMDRFVISKIVQSQKRRTDYISNIKEQIGNLQEKTLLLKQVSTKIIYEEIPVKQHMYIERKLEPILKEMEMAIQNQKNIFDEKLSKVRKSNFIVEFSEEKTLDENVQQFLKRVSK